MDRDDLFPADRLRAYLHLLATRELRDDPGAISRSDLVQQTLLEAWKDRDRFRGRTEAEWLAWARRILACNLADARRHAHRAQRDVRRQRSLQDELDRSSAELGGWLASVDPSPAQGVVLHERAARLAWALAQLPDAQREALVLQHWEGLTLTQIAARLGRTPAAVAGLLKRGLAGLRELLPDPG
jgi:RNA polymerase sigma-70 factor, ECF subfamily